MNERKKTAWENLSKLIEECKKCPLGESGKQAVIGYGNTETDLMFVGEGPGAEEDERGLPFVGRAGQLLDKIFESVSIKREQLYITNVVKCRPPNNRVPTIEEMTACDQYLMSQIALINPKIIVCLGSIPTKWLLKTTEGISKLRGKWFNWRGILVRPMFHPSYLLRNASNKVGSPKYYTWIDIQEIKQKWLELKGE